MKKRYLFAVLFTMIVMIIFFKKDRESTLVAGIENNESDQKARLDTDQKSEEIIKKQLIETEALKEKATRPAATQDQIDEVEKSFSIHLKELGQCLGVANAVDQEKIGPQFDNLVSSLKPAFGDVLVRMDDWTQWDVKTPEGTVKRIRTENEYLENNNPTKRLQLYRLNDQGMPELQNLTDEQAINPSDDYLESLRADGKTFVDEKGSRAYYTEGEELVFVERNGKIQSFSMSKGEKTFSCTDTDSSTSNCQCL